MRLPTVNNTHKRNYLCDSIKITHECPECGKENTFNNRTTTFLCYGTYCHVYSCDFCDYESEDKMYQLNDIGEDWIDVTFNVLNNLKVFERKWSRLQ